nr:MAG TPA: hypothetical protein [Caudoviricetes sp.]
MLHKNLTACIISRVLQICNSELQKSKKLF